MKIKQVITSLDIPLFKKLKDNWKDIDLARALPSREVVESFVTVPEIELSLDFYRTELTNVIVRDDYREFIELSIVFLSRDTEKKLK